MSPPELSPASPQRDSIQLAALLFSLAFPTLVTLVYFQWLSGTSPAIQQAAYSIGKIIQFGFPILWVFLFFRSRLVSPEAEANSPAQIEPDSRVSWTVSTVFGLGVAVAMLVVYSMLIQGTPLGDQLSEMVRQKVDSMNLLTPWKFIAVGLFYAVCHSFLEEYYWRWFVCWFANRWVSQRTAIVLSSLGFAAHHVILLGYFLGWDQIYTYLFSIGIAVGGAFWALLFFKTGRLRECWWSHAIIDAAIFAIGYWILWGQ